MATLQIGEETEILVSRTGIRVCGSIVASQLLADELMHRADGFFWTTTTLISSVSSSNVERVLAESDTVQRIIRNRF
jgi:hypothetical protein